MKQSIIETKTQNIILKEIRILSLLSKTERITGGKIPPKN
jgi:hypothetical protein